MDPSPRDELNTVLNHLFDFARRQIERHGEFFPFAAAVAANGELRAVATQLDDDRPLSTAVIEDLYRVLTAEAASGEIRAAGVCADVLVTLPGAETKTDALRADLEHVADDPVRVFLPYRKKRLRGYEWGELVAEPGERHLQFASSS
ncbi:MAG TPA: hypothetical protein VFU33_07630 [Gaiellaceae bacterium]|nr:hypothetical protein [Gaiellaceae bacterium]